MLINISGWVWKTMGMKNDFNEINDGYHEINDGYEILKNDGYEINA